jgi:outer membrane receptor protein involved in Fe transport
VSNAFYRGTLPRVYVDSAPHTVANTGLTLSQWRKFSGSLRYRHIDGYRLDGLDPSIRAFGFDLVDLNLTRELRHGLEFNFAIDNLTDKRYFETQNFFASRLRPQDPQIERVHATSGFSRAFTIGFTIRLGER